MANLSGCCRAASMATWLELGSQLGGWITAPSTPAAAISASSSSLVKTGTGRCGSMGVPLD
ncbi:MAG TPA: hypothetical protein VFE41_03415 [Acetobacteraceae bacterium]|nr:hypothetical protein [Acetobacteraceae bacterium]